MIRYFEWKSFLATLTITLLFAGCQPQQPRFLFPKGNVAGQYISEQTRIEYPDTKIPTLDDVCSTLAPLTLDNPDPKEEWLLTLDEIRQMALENSKVLRQLSGVNFSPSGVNGMPTMLLSSPGASMTVWDPAIIESNPQFGVQAALSAFDAVWSSTIAWDKRATPQNVPVNQSSVYGTQNQAGTFQTTLSKVVATGGNVYTSTGAGYDWGDADRREWSSNWTSYLEAGFRQPLLRGAGIEYNRIAGPNGSPGNSNGVVLARINTDMALVDFEMGVRNTLQDIEETYWNLYYAYRSLSAAGAGLDAALQSWRMVKAQFEVGHAMGTAQNIAQAEQNYQRFKVSVQEAQSNLYKNEQLLRYMIGIAPTDGRLVKPVDEPTIARVKYDWNEIVAEALARAPELRKQKWNIKKYELQLIAQRNYLLPQVDFEGNYRFHGMGHELINLSSNKPYGSSTDATSSLYSGRWQDWGMGVTATVPIGFRQEMAAVRNAELMIARERSILQEQELELVHNLSDLYRDLDRTYRLIEDYLAVLRAARKEFRAVSASYDVGKTTMYELLNAQQKLAEAETSYYRMVIDYNIAIVSLNFRKGSLLEYNGITLAEGPWANKAYFDAYRRARERDASKVMDYGFTRPQVFSRGAYPQIQGTDPTVAQVASNQGQAGTATGGSSSSNAGPGTPAKVIKSE